MQIPFLQTTRFRVVLVMAAAAIFTGASIRAADPSADDAKKRATLFQTEARRIFEKDHWTIIRRGGDGFTAIHPAADKGATPEQENADAGSALIVHVSITFNPKSADSTDCVVKVEGFRLIRKKGERSHLAGPFKADYPENANYIRKVLENAEDELGRKYPKYQAK